MRRLTVLGGCAAYPEPGRACTGFLIEYDGFRLVLDLGYATLPRLLNRLPAANPDAVVITHEHPDHCLDLHGLFRIRFYGPQPDAALPLYCPPGVLDRLAGIEPDAQLRAVFEVHELPGTHDVGPFRLTGIALPHFVQNVGVRFENPDGCPLAFTGDTGPSPAIAELGRNADLFVVEATGRPGETERMPRGLLTPTEAGAAATQAGARRLLLTHFWPDNDRAVAVREAAAEFTGEILTAEEDAEIPLV